MRSLRIPALLIVLLVSAATAHAQTGKIAGTVTDAVTGEPLPGVNVVVTGTTVGATTDTDGYYSIINVRPGIHSVRASFIGFSPQIVENVDVNIDLTTEVDFELREEAVGLEEIVVTSQQPVIQRDIAASQRNIDALEITQGRYQDFAHVLSAQVSSNTISSYVDRPQLRGDEFTESLFLVDGVAQGDPLTNTPYYKVNLDAVEEVKVQTGGFSAEYGNVRSGVINVVTKEGGRRYSGSVNVQYSAPALKHFGPDMFGFESPLVVPFVDPEQGAFEGGHPDFGSAFPGWNKVAQDEGEAGVHFGKPMELYARYLWRHRSDDAIAELKRLEKEGIVQFADGVDPDDMAWQQAADVPDYRMSFTLGGPVPLIRPLTFFVAYDQFQQEYAYSFPTEFYRDKNFRGKLTFTPARGMKLNLTSFYSTQRGGAGGQGPSPDSDPGAKEGGYVSSNPFISTGSENKYWYPHCAVPANRLRQIYAGRFTHALSSNTFYEIQLTHSRTDYEMDMEMRNTAPIPGTGDPNDPSTWIRSSSDGSGSGIDKGRIGTEAEAEARAAEGALGWENWRDWAMIRIGDHWYDEAPKGYGPVNWRDVTGEYRMESCNLRADESFTRQWVLDGNMTSQINRHNQVRTGFQARYDKLDQYYEAIDPSVNAGNVWDSRVDQYVGAVYAQDKIEYRGFVANVGLRLDWLVSGEFPTVLKEGCDLTDPASCVGEEGPYSQALAPGNTTKDVEGGRILGTKENIVKDNFPTTRHTQTRVSPRIGISHPISTVAKVFFNYGHFWQWPSLRDMYMMRMDTRNGFRVEQLGNPLVEPERTIQYEIGYEQNLFNRMHLRMTGYYKDINNEIDDIEIHPLSFGGGSFDLWRNTEFRDVRGLELFLELRRGTVPYVSGWLSGNYLVESGAEYGFEEFFENPSDQAELADTEVSNPDVRPLVRANLNFTTPDDFLGPDLGDVSLLGGFSINLTFMWQRGAQFTWNPADIPLVEDNVRWQPYQRWDLRLNKSLFRSGTVESVFYIDVTNLFNNRNMTPFNAPGPDPEDPNIDDRNWAWNGHKWWKNQDRAYMESLGYSAENQNEDGSFNDTIGKPGDWKDDRIQLPGFSPWTFLGKRDIFFGFKLYF